MQRINSIIIFTLLFLSVLVPPVSGSWFSWGKPVLVSIGTDNYTSEDMKNWWKNWREKDTVLPESPAPFVDWMLLFKEAERMKLFESPAYRKKVIIFLRARTLMLLKAEEVDSKITISDDDLWQQYKKTYAPRYQLNIFFFNKKETAQTFVDKFADKPVSDEVFSGKQSREDEYYSQRTEWYRPLAVNPAWLPVLDKLVKGQLSPPFAWKKDFVVLRLQDVVEANRKDFESVKKQLRQKVWKSKENQLTSDLLVRLRKQYHVQVNTELLEHSGDAAAGDDAANNVLISTDNGNISAEIVRAKIGQIQHFRKRNGFKVASDLQFKTRVVNGIIDQTLTSWEALARKYEERPPFKAVYQFYCQHRMIKLLEEKVFSPQAKVSDKEIAAYYQNNMTLFTRPEVIRMAIVEGTEPLLKSLWLEAALNGDFITLAQKRTGHAIPIREIPANHLNPKVKEVIDTLSKNEVSRVFTVDDHVSLVQLIERKVAKVIPLSEVKETIKTTLYTAKIEKLRRSYLDKLRKKYVVKINENVWQKLRKELEQ